MGEHILPSVLANSDQQQQQQRLPDSFDGWKVTVKNTFLNLGEAGAPTHSHRRSRSAPGAVLAEEPAEEAFMDGDMPSGWRTLRMFSAPPAEEMMTNSGSSTPSHVGTWTLSTPPVEETTDSGCSSPSFLGTWSICDDSAIAKTTAIVKPLPEYSDFPQKQVLGSPRSGGSLATSVGSTAIPEAKYGRWTGVESDDESDDEESHGRTTLMVRNLPEGLTRQSLEELFDREGFAYDFIYLPADISTGVSFEYCFVNLVSEDEASRFFRRFTDFSRWPVPCTKKAGVHWSEALQGLDQLIERYRNSPLMHPNVPDTLRPAIYSTGLPIVFPPPTQPIRAPRVRRTAAKARRKTSTMSSASEF